MERVANNKKQKQNNKFKVWSEEPYADALLQMYLEHDNHNYEIALEEGSTVEGTLVGYNDKYIFVDIGYKDFVMVEGRKDEFNVLTKLNKGSGDKIEVMLTQVTEEPYQIIGSFTSLDKRDVYDGILNNLDSVVVTAKALEWSPAGFKVEVNHEGFKIPAFMPNTLAGINKLSQEQAQTLVGKEMLVMVETYQGEKGTFVVSRKKYLQTLIPQAIAGLKIRDEEDNPVSYVGTVTGTTKFGVFVEFNDCLTGMVHIANLAPEYKAQLQSQTIQPGTQISFYVKEVLKGKLILTQIWRTTLWDTIGKDDTFEAPIKDFKKFGALVQLDEETVALIHNSEMEKANKTFKAGETVKVKVLSIQRMERKIFLTLA
jgi:ribosomal protein S1